MGSKKSSGPSAPPPDYKGMWKAYQEDVMMLGRDVSSMRATAAASGRRLTGEEGEAFEAEQAAFRDEGMAEIKKGTAYKTLSKKYKYNMEGQLAKKYGTIKGYSAPKSSISGLGNLNLGNLNNKKFNIKLPGLEDLESGVTPAEPERTSSGSRWIMRNLIGEDNKWS